mmetsp:Transcript_27038/g.81045  ORF Transcript_27038/g.81045 Transcript_27038/m.81045 type:complete len:502 (-) Transcript_27038:86-1591(-)
MCIAPLDVQAFRELDVRIIKSKNVPPYGRGTRLNRYHDILPSPMTRIVLPKLDDDPETTYINANYVRGYGGRSAKEYIAAQGPTPATLVAFLRMVWVKKVRVIVMVTGFVEKGKKKCERYLPESPADAPLTFGDITVSTDRVVRGDAYNTTSIVLTCGREKLRVEHVWYHAWPDHGVPTNAKGEINATDVLALLQHTRHLREASDGRTSPLLVHCSAGVGRTGTFIVIDHVMDAIKQRKEVDLIQLIDEIREDRMALVQHVAQYRFAWQACITFAKTHIVDTLGGEIYALASAEMSRDARRSMRRQNSWRRSRRASGETVLTYNPNSPSLRQTAEDLKQEAEAELNRARDSIAAEAAQHDIAAAGAGADAKQVEFDENVSLEKQMWFRKRLTRQQVAETLEEQPVGTFLVRPSSKPGLFTLSVVTGPAKLTSFLITPMEGDGGKVCYVLGAKGKGPTYPSVVELIANHVAAGKLVTSINDRGEQVQIVKGHTAETNAEFEC